MMLVTPSAAAAHRPRRWLCPHVDSLAAAVYGSDDCDDNDEEEDDEDDEEEDEEDESDDDEDDDEDEHEQTDESDDSLETTDSEGYSSSDGGDPHRSE